jgi:hypothetical protein
LSGRHGKVDFSNRQDLRSVGSVVARVGDGVKLGISNSDQARARGDEEQDGVKRKREEMEKEVEVKILEGVLVSFQLAN